MKTPELPPRWMKLSTASKVADASVDTLYREIRAGRLKAKKGKGPNGAYRVSMSQLEAWFESLEDA